jgi:hypothetical protein
MAPANQALKPSEMIDTPGNITQDEALKPYVMIDAPGNITHDETLKPYEMINAPENVTQDVALKPYEMINASGSVTQDEAMKPSEMTKELKQRLEAAVDDHEARYLALLLQTIMDEMGQMESTERMVMM